MKLNVPQTLAPALTTAFCAALLLTGCATLPRELRREISDTGTKLQQTEKQFQRTSDEIRDDLAHSPDLFNATPVAGEWRAKLAAAKGRLAAAETDRRELENLAKSGGKETVPRIRQLLTDEERLRSAAIEEAGAIQAQATRWLDFQRNLPHYLAKMREDHDAIHSVDFSRVGSTVEKAEQDWPAKKADLEKRLETLKTAPDRAESQWQSTEAARQAATAGNASGSQIATLIQADDVIATSAHLSTETEQLSALCGQLYNAWDKVLDDLDVEHHGADTVYREKLKIVRTHFAEAGDKSPQTSTDERWVETSPAAYQAVENDLGMAISHKDAGFYDSEAQNTAQPAGFAYIAPPSAGSNQYGYWTHNDRGSFWTFLPQYLIMRELFWGHSYRPIVVNEYNSYYSAARTGRTYYGQETPAAPPRYGSHGTFTQQHYASSRYVQSGGFRNSAFASHASPQTAPSPRFGNEPASGNGQGKRFGGAAPSGKRFGGGGGGARPAGKSFGGGHRR